MTAAIYPTLRSVVDIALDVADVVVLTPHAQVELLDRLYVRGTFGEGAHALARIWSYHCPSGIAPVAHAYYGTKAR